MAKTNYRKDIRKYLRDLSEKGLQPGGGSAGALAFSLGTSLIIKSLRHTMGKDLKNQKSRLKEILKKISSLQEKIYPYIDKDGEFFSDIINSKGKKRQESLKKTEELIKDLGRSASEVFFLVKPVKSDIKKNIRSDFDLGLEFIKVAKRSVDFNLAANKNIFTKSRASGG